MTDIASASRFIAVAAPSDLTTKEWRKINPAWNPAPVHQDYALMKVLYTLRIKNKTERYRVNLFKWDTTLVPVDFSGLEDSDVIFIVGHGDHNGLYALGPSAKDNTPRLVELLTKDGNLKKKRAEKDIKILLLSCRAGLGFHKTVAHALFVKLGRDVTVGGAIGFTFGSLRTTYLARNEVLIKGIPWFIEYPLSITKREAEKETSKREGKTITVDGKKKEIDAFKVKKEKIEDGLKKIVAKLSSTEVNDALDEIEKDHKSKWLALIESQFDLYGLAKTKHNLEFDMWFDLITDGYVWTTGKKLTAAAVAPILQGSLSSLNDEGTSVK